MDFGFRAELDELAGKISLTPGEVGRVVRAAVGAAAGETPVVAPAGYGTALAIELAKDAAGADALLLLPPYLTEAGKDGLVAHVRDDRDRPARRPGTAAPHRPHRAGAHRVDRIDREGGPLSTQVTGAARAVDPRTGEPDRD